MKHLTKFVISDTQYLIINPECISPDECEFCANVDIDYVDTEKNVCIRFGYKSFQGFCRFLANYELFSNLIKGEMVLDSTIDGYLGIEWNKYFEGKIKKTEVSKYHCWSNSHKLVRPYFSSWMYNDEKSDIIFEITPFYPWHGQKKSTPGYVTYKEFMKDYKPVLRTIIPKESLKLWIGQAKELIKIYFPEFAEK